MRTRSAVIATVLLGSLLPVVAPAGLAAAGSGFTISVPDPNVKLKESFTVEGSGACAESPYTVTFTYTDHDGATRAVQASGTTNGDGAFSESITVPEAAEPRQPAQVQATSTCASSPSPSASGAGAPLASRQGGGTTSNTVAINIEIATGVLSIDRTQGRAGTVVNVSGTNCLGDEVVVVFGNNSGADSVEVTLRPDDTFSGTYTIPNVPPGPYFFAAACPGTDYEDRPFTVLPTPGASPSPLPPAVPRPVDYTG